MTRDNWSCQIKDDGCLGRATQADHITPVGEGGQYTLDNGQAACASCHKNKTQMESLRARAARW